VKRHRGLNEDASWIVLDEANELGCRASICG
jgi:hypothetical protein